MVRNPGKNPSPAKPLARVVLEFPTQTVQIAGREVTLIALPLLFAQFRRAGRLPDNATKVELMRAVKVYNSISNADETSYEQAIMREYSAFVARSH